MVRVEEMQSARRVTPGLIRAIGKQQSKKACHDCDFPIPIYPGRYPKTCPNCGNPSIGDAQPMEDRDGSRTTAG